MPAVPPTAYISTFDTATEVDEAMAPTLTHTLALARNVGDAPQGLLFNHQAQVVQNTKDWRRTTTSSDDKMHRMVL